MVTKEKLFVLGRGEGAVRVMGTARKMGLVTAAAFTPDDEGSLHVSVADEAYPIESYSDIEGNVKVAKRNGVTMIHPVWGPASENPKLASACKKANIVFVGPSARSMRKAGHKERIKEVADDVGVPRTVSTPPRIKIKRIPGWAKRNGLSEGMPMILKAATAGGGNGNQVVSNLRELYPAIENVKRRVGRQGGGSNRVYMEHYLKDVRHVEVQVIGDQYGNLVGFGDRDSTIQYLYQKLAEEGPAPFLTSEQHMLLQGYALRIGNAIGYSSAGTVEFLMTPEGEIYFMEFNPRLQVEHGVTELITGYDLVELQIRIAQGERLPFRQEDIKFDGVAIEARVNAQTINPQDPKKLIASGGVVEHVIFPEGEGIRVDHSLYDGYEMNLNYNPTQAKVIAWAPSRQEAIERLKDALGKFVIEGVKTNIPLLLVALSHPKFLNGEHKTTFFAETLEEMEKAGVIGVAVALGLKEWQRQEKVSALPTSGDIWRQAGRLGQVNRGLNFRARR